MIRVSVSYPASDGARFDMDYYLKRHIPLTSERYGNALLGFEVYEATHGGDGSAPAVLVTGHFYFVSLERLAEVAALHNAELMADIPNYTNVVPVVLIESKRATGGST